jgi:hypothetical protein
MYTNSELLDSVITEMYALFKGLISGNYTGFCAAFVDILSKLSSLREGLKKADEANAKRVEELKAQLERALTVEPEPGGKTIGGETTHYNYDPTEG